MSEKKSLKKQSNPKENDLESLSPREHGDQGFSASYWSENYDVPDEMDGIVNARQHAEYLKSFFAVDYVDINSVIDFGFGLGHLFRSVLKEFRPYRAWGIEPSVHAYRLANKESWKPVPSTKLVLRPWSLGKWASEVKPQSKHFDLGICTSVFQYLTDKELKTIVPVMARQVKYLYFSVPTDLELKRQVSDLDFKDEFAIKRSKEFYLELLSPSFTIVGARVLESKVHFSEETSFFTDYLFRT